MAFQKIEDFKGVHQGKRLFILASGPSLADLDLSRLDRRIVMGLNRSFFAYPKTHYHCCFDPRIFKEYPELLKETRYLFTVEERPWGIPIRMLGSEDFSFDLTEGIYTGYTISYFALQVALYMGFKQVFYLGLDLRTKGGSTHFFGHDFHSRNHDTTEFPRMKRMIEYGLAKLAEHDIEVYNCSPFCEIDALPYADFEWALSL